MTVAALDTSFGIAFAYSVSPGHVWRGYLPGSVRAGDAQLLPWLLEALAAGGLKPAQVDRWTVGLGPGSFSGIRAGIALVKGICGWSGAPHRGLPSSLAIALAAARDLSGPGRIAVVYDARKSEFTAGIYERLDDGAVREVTGPALTDAAALVARSADCVRVVTLADDGAAAILPPELRARHGTVAHVDAGLLLDPAGWPWPVGDAGECDPIYVRPPVFVPPVPPPRDVSRLLEPPAR